MRNSRISVDQEAENRRKRIYVPSKNGRLKTSDFTSRLPFLGSKFLLSRELEGAISRPAASRRHRTSRFQRIQLFDNQYLILVMSRHIQAAEHDLLLAYESRTDHRRESVSSSLSGYMAGYGTGYSGGVCSWGLLAVLMGKVHW